MDDDTDEGEESSVERSDLDSGSAAQTEKLETDQRLDGQEPPEVTVDDLNLDHVEPKYRARIRDMLRKYSSMWDGSLGEINTTEHHIDLEPDTRPIRQARVPCWPEGSAIRSRGSGPHVTRGRD